MVFKRLLLIGAVILSLVSVTGRLPGDQKGEEKKKRLPHEMTEAERALMPAYLESLRRMKTAAAAPPPPAPVRNIAEFEHMEGVLIAYPLGIPVPVVAEMSEDLMVTTILDETQEDSVRDLYSAGGVNMNHCNFLHAPHNTYWTRDYGPWFVTDGLGRISIIDFIYNRPRFYDNMIPLRIANFLGLDLYEMELLHAGGNYMTDGWGISVSTDLVWEENPDYTASRVDRLVKDYLGVHTYHVTGDPLGERIRHVDCWGKYLAVDKILIARVSQSSSRYGEYEAAAAYFAGQVSGYGSYYRVYRVDSLYSEPYTNSIILNRKVLVPIVKSPGDADALLAYQTAMPGYEVLGFTGRWLTTDALHCRVIGIPDRGMLYIDHLPLLDDQPEAPQYDITVDIIPYSGRPLIGDSVKIYYAVDGGAYRAADMVNTAETTYTGVIPGQAPGSRIVYYIHAADTSGRTREHPYIGSSDPHVFTVGSSGVQDAGRYH